MAMSLGADLHCTTATTVVAIGTSLKKMISIWNINLAVNTCID
jgi:hypothetical protein